MHIVSPARSVSASADALFTPGRFALLLGLFMAVSFPEVLFGSQTFVYRDFGYFGYPLAFYHRQSFWQGQIPLWNPLNHCGIPFLAQWNTLTLYPLSLIYLLFPLTWSLGFFTIFHIFLGGLGMRRLAQDWTGNPFAAAVAGMAFAFNGLSLNCLLWPNNAAALGWMPWVVWAVQRGWRAGERKLLAAAALASLQFLTGAPEIILLTWVLLLCLALADFFQSKPIPWKYLIRFSLIGVVVAGICAAQLLPFLDLAAHSQRHKDYGGPAWSMPGWGIVSFLTPLFYTFVVSNNVRFQYDQCWTSSYYLGVGIFAWSLLAVVCVKNRLVKLLGLVALISVILAMGPDGLLYAWIKPVFPLLGFIRFPAKFVILVVFISPLLAAWFVDYLSANPLQKPVRPIIVTGGVLLAIIAFTLWFAARFPQYQPPYDNWPLTLQSGLTRAGFLILFLGLALLIGHSRLKPGWLHLAILGCLWADVMTHAPRIAPTAARGVFDPGLDYIKPAPAHGVSRAMMSPAALDILYHESSSDTFTNYFLNRLALNCNVNLLDGVSKIDGFYSLNMKESEIVRNLLYKNRGTSFAPLLDFLGVSHVTSAKSVFDWDRRPGFLPLITAGQKPVFLDGLAVIDELASTNFAGSQVVYLPTEARGIIQATNTQIATVSQQNIAAEEIRFRVQTAGPAMVVIAQSFYHPWKCYIDGAPARLWKANWGFQAFEAPPGDHSIRVVYDDKIFKAGLGISLLSLLGLGIGFLRSRRPRNFAPSTLEAGVRG